MTDEQYLIYLRLFAISEGYDLIQLFVDGDYKTIEMLSDKMNEMILSGIKEIFGL